MSSIPSFGNTPIVQITPLLPVAQRVTGQTTSAHPENAKIEKSAKDFESILLGNWLQQAEQSFASLPGGDEEGDADSAKEQFQGFAMQSLGNSMTAAGGIGIAKVISAQLHKAEDAGAARAEKSNQNPAK